MPLVPRLLGFLAILALSACALPGQKHTENLGAFRVAVEQTKVQTFLMFDGVNEFARKQSVSRLQGDPQALLDEKAFPLLVPLESRQEWTEVYGLLSDYAGLLVRLSDPERAKASGDLAAGLIGALNKKPLDAEISGGFAALFSSTAAAIAGTKGRAGALSVMKETDRDFSRVIEMMAERFGKDPSDEAGLVFAIDKGWRDILGGLRIEHASLPAKDPKKAALVEQYVKALDARDTQLRSLIELRKSTLALSAMHGAMARGQERQAVIWLEQIELWTADVNARNAVFAGGK